MVILKRELWRRKRPELSTQGLAATLVKGDRKFGKEYQHKHLKIRAIICAVMFSFFQVKKNSYC